MTTSAPTGPVDIPDEAITALQSLRDALADTISQPLEFGIGLNQVDGQYTSDLALIVLIPELPGDQQIPDTFGGFPVGVWPAQLALIDDTAVYDPVVGGIQIGPPVTAAGGDGVLGDNRTGTLGAIATRRSDGTVVLLTAGHVLPSSGDDVFQPGAQVTGRRAVGTVDQTISTPGDGLDCATATLKDGQGAAAEITELGWVAGSALAGLWEQVFKRGATTGKTSGLVVTLLYDLSQSTRPVTGMYIDTFPFNGVFCWHGDSGSAVVNGNDEVVALLWAMDRYAADSGGNPVRAIGRATPIDRVLDALQIDIKVEPTPA
jgi:hypothetical protein